MGKEKIVFITGATAGFGMAMARRFVKEGHRVIATGRRENRLMELQKELGVENLLPLVFDVSNRKMTEHLIKNLPEKWKDIDILINNAGGALGLEKAHEVNLDDWEAMVDANIKGLMYCTRFLLPEMVKRNHGHIVNLGSIAGEFPYPGGNVYGATKAFVYQFSLNLRADLLGTKVRVTDIQPGLCGGTEFSLVRFHGNAEKAAAVYQGTQPLTADDIADAIYWVTSRPDHININSIQLMPVCQAFGAFAIDKQ